MEVSGDGGDEDEAEDVAAESKSTRIDEGLEKFAKKMPIFEPDERVASGSGEKPLTVNLDLALYRAKVLARSYQYEEAEKLLQKVCV